MASAPLYIAVDDRDPNITTVQSASAQLLQGGSVPDFAGTNTELFASDLGLQSMTLTFYGTGIEVHNTLHSTPLTLNFTLDGSHYTNTTSNDTRAGDANIFHQTVFSTAALSPPLTLSEGTPHTLTMAIEESTNAGASTWLDYYVVQRPASAWVDGMSLFYDDSDPRVLYSGNWVQNGTDQAMQGTLHTATSSGSTATLSFNGSTIKIYGSLSAASTTGSVLTVTLDALPPTVVPPPTNPFTQLGIAPNVLLFSSTLDAGAHTLVMAASEAGVFGLDYVLVTGVAGGASGGGGGGGETTAGAGSGGGTGAGGSTPGSTPTFTTSTFTPHAHADIAAIAGGVVGAVLALALLAAALLFVALRRRQERRAAGVGDGGDAGGGGVYKYGPVGSAYTTPGHEMSSIPYPTGTYTASTPAPAPASSSTAGIDALRAASGYGRSSWGEGGGEGAAGAAHTYAHTYTTSPATADTLLLRPNRAPPSGGSATDSPAGSISASASAFTSGSGPGSGSGSGSGSVTGAPTRTPPPHTPAPAPQRRGTRTRKGAAETARVPSGGRTFAYDYERSYDGAGSVLGSEAPPEYVEEG